MKPITSRGVRVLIALASTALPAACSPPDTSARLIAGPDTPRVSGTIDAAFTDRFVDAYEGSNRLAVTSTGGEAVRALVMARVVAPRELHLFIDDHCLSACASLPLPAADTVTFGPDAVVGMHYSPAMTRRVYVRDFGTGDDCYVRSGDGERQMLEAAGRRPSFADEVYDRLQPGPARAIDIGDVCPRIEYDLTHQWWFPTSTQLRDLMGLEFTGTVCADDPACMRRRLPNLRIEATVVVGDEIWTLPLE